MEITWHGQSCFSIKGDAATIVVDPFGPEIGILPPLSADIVVVTHDHFDHNYVQAVAGRPEIVRDAGPHTARGVTVTGYSTWHDSRGGLERGRNIVFQIEMDGLRLAHLGDLGEPLSAEAAAALANVDVLMVPVGRHVTIDIPECLKLIQLIAPKITVPMHYRTPSSPDASFLDPIDAFCDAVNGCPAPQPKLDILAGDVRPARIVLLTVT